MISPRDQETLRQRFSQELQGFVRLKLFTQRASQLTVPGRECRYCPQTQQLLEELTALTPKLSLEIVDVYAQQDEVQKTGVQRIPCTILSQDGESRLKYYGIPSGYEFATLLEDVVALSRRENPLKPATLQKLQRVQEELHIQVFVTPT